MGFFKRVKQLFTGASPDRGQLVSLLRDKSRRDRKGPRAQLRSYHEVPPFYSALDRISKDFASQDWTFRVDGSVVTNHPAVRAHENPHPMFNGYQFRILMMLYLDILGECFAVMLETEDGLEFWPIPPFDVERATDRQSQTEALWEVQHNRFTTRVSKQQMFHLKRPDLLEPYGRGKGMGDVLSDELQIIESASTFEKSELENQARPDIIVNLAGGNEEAVKAFKKEWNKKFKGPSKTGKPLVSGGSGELDIETLSPPIKDTKLPELRELSAKEVQHTFGIPPTLLGRVESTTRATANAERKVYAENTLIPRLKEWNIGWTQQVLDLFNEDIVAEWSDPRPDDLKRRKEIMKQHPEKFTVNEIRKEAGKPPREDGDVYLRPPERKLIVIDAEDVTADEQAPGEGQSRGVESSDTEFVELSIDPSELESPKKKDGSN